MITPFFDAKKNLTNFSSIWKKSQTFYKCIFSYQIFGFSSFSSSVFFSFKLTFHVFFSFKFFIYLLLYSSLAKIFPLVVTSQYALMSCFRIMLHKIGNGKQPFWIEKYFQNLLFERRKSGKWKIEELKNRLNLNFGTKATKEKR